jgi:lipoprotein-releasing system permease protein
MFRPIALYIGLRYTRAKRRNHFISFISLVSMLGIALGITVLITVLSVMNGFDYEIRTKLFDMAYQVTVSDMQGQVANWQQLSEAVKKYPSVAAAAPFVNGQGMLSNNGHALPVMVTGISPSLNQDVVDMSKNIVIGNINSLQPKSFGIVIGQAMAENLNLNIGDKVILFTPQATASPLGIMPRLKQFTVVGIFHVESNPALDREVTFINLRDAQVLYNLGDTVSGLRLKVSDLYAAPRVSDELENALAENYIISNWTQDYGAFFKAIRMEKTMMFIILLLIIAVAAFNLVSTLVMVVTDKQAEIAILRTLGATPGMIMATFIVQGCVVGIVGTFLGLIGGVLLALNATNLVNLIQNVFHVEFISSSIYFINYLPSRLEWTDVWHVCLIALILSLVATLYPAWQASRTQPAEALRYE